MFHVCYVMFPVALGSSDWTHVGHIRVRRSGSAIGLSIHELVRSRTRPSAERQRTVVAHSALRRAERLVHVTRGHGDGHGDGHRRMRSQDVDILHSPGCARQQCTNSSRTPRVEPTGFL